MSSINRAGVTLLELLIVVTLVGSLMAVALPRAQTARTQLAVEAAAAQLQGDLVRARVEAVRQNASVTITKSGADSYTITNIGTRTLPNGVSFSASTASSYVFPSFGPSVSGSKTFNVQLRGYSKVVTVNTSGMARIQ